MPLLCMLALVLLVPRPAAAERYKLTFIPGSPEGQVLELMIHHLDPKRKVEEIQRFLQNHPKHEAVSYLLEWLQTYHARENRHREVIDFGTRLLVLHPDDFDALWRCRKAAEALGDPAVIAVWQKRLLDLSARMVKSQPPRDLDAATWAANLELAKGLLAEQEYTIFRKAVDTASPREQAMRLEAFNSAYPASEYVAKTYPYLLHAYQSLGDPNKVLAVSDRLLRQDPDNVAALLATAQIFMDRRTNYPKVIASATRIIELVSAAKPDSDLEQNKAHYLGSANLLLGNAYVNTNAFPAADKALRAALPYLKGTGQTEAAVLFYLGWSNYHMERYREATAYFKACLPHGGAYAEQATRNLTAMRNERRITE
ncbi:MAG: hypothetical protein JNK87_20245 [Bryobacterales bacterium]|nr:hypothetical protein [Bryobacterales bacterium]